MAYINAQQVKEKRNAIKKAFPAKNGWKFSVTKDNWLGINIYLMQYPKGYSFPDHEQINHYHLDLHKLGKRETAVLKKLTEIAMQGNHDNSDIMTDYFDVGWYFHLSIGKWDKPAVMQS